MKFRKTSEEIGVFGLDGGMRDGDVPLFESLDVVVAEKGSSKNRSSTGAAMKRDRLQLGLFLALLVFGIFSAKTAYLQLWQGEYYRTVAEANRIRVHAIPAHRGILTDRNGRPLAENKPSFRLIAYQSALGKKETRDGVMQEVAERFGLAAEELVRKLDDAGNNEEILLTEDVPYDQAVALLSEGSPWPGIAVELSERRGYPTAAIPTLSHVLGYTGPVNEKEFAELKDNGYRKFDIIGKQGIEAVHELELRGTFGQEVLEVNAAGNTLRTISRKEPVSGNDLTLTLDAGLQSKVENVLQKYLEKEPVKRAAVVALDPRNGEVLALVSYPAFDANHFTEGISVAEYEALVNDPNAPLFARATAGKYPSGSTIKPFFAAAALTEGVITPQTAFYSTGGIMLGNRFFPDWKSGGHGYTNVYHAIAESVNTFFYIIGGGNESFNGLGVERLMSYAGKFGLGRKTGIDITGEAEGFLPSKEWKEVAKGEPWYIGDTYNVAIGQGDILVTPLQMARGTAAIANGGELVTPHLVIGEEAPEERIIQEDVANIVRDAMRQTVTVGTARSLQSLPVPAAGKTGTAQWNANKPPHSWFTGFAPFDNPEIVIAVLVEEGGNKNLATPVANEILGWYFSDLDTSVQ